MPFFFLYEQQGEVIASNNKSRLKIQHFKHSQNEKLLIRRWYVESLETSLREKTLSLEIFVAVMGEEQERKREGSCKEATERWGGMMDIVEHDLLVEEMEN